ncbi:tRNA (adenosine(37)-N6)-threonylcarbamoyltransferase complex dimerization subunit type 1 TsaB [Alphaproteobacteria bacterium]|nr:tRNA (adenosine(37)-N6)-threonylcarbamoyltransferase complex dimerization subunit type 1 TsaB [Alphaproteobacteria bacterium]
MKNKNFLSIETSLSRIFLVLRIDEKVYSVNKYTKNSIEEELNILIGKIILKNKADFSDLNFILVSLGPGSYTGSRVGLAAAKAISMSLEIPLLGFSNFNTIYLQARLDNLLLENEEAGIVIKANRQELYYQKYKKEIKRGKGVMSIISLDSLRKENNFPNIIIGNVKLELLFNSYIYCIPYKNSLVASFQDLYQDFLKGESSELEPYYINGHYAKK